MNTIGKIIQDRRKELKLRQPDLDTLSILQPSAPGSGILPSQMPHSCWHSARFLALPIFMIPLSENIRRMIRLVN